MPQRHAMTPRIPRVLSGMGRLVWLEVEDARGKIHRIDWPERGAPSVAHAGVSPSARGKPRPCYLVGGTAKLKGLRVVSSRGPVPARRLRLAQVERAWPEDVRTYARTHGGLAPHSAQAVMMGRPRPARVVGIVRATCYRANKNVHGGMVLWRHPYETSKPQRLLVDRQGHPQLSGGRVTVTPHGIEDLR